MHNIQFSGFSPLSTIDYEGKTASIIFTAGCNLSCGYCSNYHSCVKVEKFIECYEMMEKIEKTSKLVDGLVICGGEPTIWGEDLFYFIRDLQKFELPIKLDTNGTNPDTLRRCLQYLDYVALDIKEPFDKKEDSIYGHFSSSVSASLNLLRANNIKYELRTTFHKKSHPPKDIKKIKKIIKSGETWALQPVQLVEQMKDFGFYATPNYTEQELKDLL